MKAARSLPNQESLPPRKEIAEDTLDQQIDRAWRTIAPFWPLKNLIAVNPLQGLEDLPFEEALAQGARYFQRKDLPAPMQAINRESIKWLQAFFDDGQATLPMPSRNEGLYAAWCELAIHDRRLHGGDAAKRRWLAALPEQAEQAIAECFLKLRVAREDRAEFLTLMLTTLPGWAAHVKYRLEWADAADTASLPVTAADYLAMRLAITCLLWQEADSLLAWHRSGDEAEASVSSLLTRIEAAEMNYRSPLLRSLASQPTKDAPNLLAQLVFCIDVRSEPFRRTLEKVGPYQTFGFAGFFGVPVSLSDTVTGESHASCPVLLKPKHAVAESSCCPGHAQNHARRSLFRHLYQSAKYNFATPFALVEALGLASGLWMALRTFAPRTAERLRNAPIRREEAPRGMPGIDAIPLADQCAYAEGALRMMGLTKDFAPFVVFCGHGSTTRNNAYATSLDCGACGGHHGAGNARILAAILNSSAVREHLAGQGIKIPSETRFLAAEHDTTTDDVTLYKETDIPQSSRFAFLMLRADLEESRLRSSFERLKHLQVEEAPDFAAQHALSRASDWAQVRPEWGLARNAAFIVGPRALTRDVDLEGRCFLHSYDYSTDADGAMLTTILTAPMVVAQWINAQYLFSTLDNVAFGGGSKITKNISGKLGIMQGNASDLMTGLSLQSVHATSEEAYHETQRLMTVVYAPRHLLDDVIKGQPVLRKLFGNGWVRLACIDPSDRRAYQRERDGRWVAMDTAAR